MSNEDFVLAMLLVHCGRYMEVVRNAALDSDHSFGVLVTLEDVKRCEDAWHTSTSTRIIRSDPNNAIIAVLLRRIPSLVIQNFNFVTFSYSGSMKDYIEGFFTSYKKTLFRTYKQKSTAASDSSAHSSSLHLFLSLREILESLIAAFWRKRLP